MYFVNIWALFIIAASQCLPLNALHVKGRWRSTEFYKFFAKFGFQQTDAHHQVDTQGYIYGNITSINNVTTPLTFVVVDGEYFVDYYTNRTVIPREKACPLMFKKIETKAWDYSCHPDGKEDYLRKIPCVAGSLCAEEDDPGIVVDGYQFTFSVQDKIQPRFWFTSGAACYLNSSSCIWTHNEDQDIYIDFDIWFVNGNPYTKHFNPFEHQFSFEMHDVVEIHLVFFLLYLILVPIQVKALLSQSHPITKLLTVCMTMEFLGAFCNVVHVIKFAYDGEGEEVMKHIGNFIDMVGQCMLVLLLLLIAKGWAITRTELTHRKLLFGIWGAYALANMFLFIWNLTEIDIISDIDEWQTWPGYLILAFRMCIMAWFMFELQSSFALERGQEKTRFYLHFGAGFLVWFIYLPILVLIGSQLSALWRFKTMLSIMYGSDFLAFAILVHLLWPTRSAIYFNLDNRFNRRQWDMNELKITGLLSDSEDENIEMSRLVSDSEELQDERKPSGRSYKNGFISPSSRALLGTMEESEM